MLAGLMAVAPLSIDLYLPGLDHMAAEFDASAEAAQATVAIYLAGLAFGQFAYGPASDRLGRRPVLILGLAVYTAASLACALAPAIGVMIGARFAQALGGCACMVIIRAVIRDCFDHQEAARFFSLLALVAGAAPVLGPLFGGFLVAASGWRIVFFLLSAFGAGLALAVFLMLPETRSEATRSRARSENPFKAYAALLKIPGFRSYLVATGMNLAAMFAYIAASSPVLSGLFALTPIEFGFAFAANAAGLVAGSQINRILLKHRRADWLLKKMGLAGAVLAGVLCMASLFGAHALWVVLACFFATTTLVGMIQGNVTAGALSVDPERAGSASALLGGASFFCGTAAAFASGALFDNTARPALLVMTACLAISAGAVFLLKNNRPGVV
ncbi:Bcr/CflA family drug resistance efflux transporter [Marinicaulis flavus]|uniref:Bcr/CflA family efflux transporter n=1 Tax=Hyphococcus luteus TaxID=2058213 RepID=A0A2S7K5A1_9PROT|nr:Bcr/CflA family drug resistance efflux transporter [Marinicaulis flavus]